MSRAITRTMTIIIVVAVVVIAGVAGGVYYSTLPSAPTTQTTTQVPRGLLKVGFTYSSQGTYAVEGTASLNGIKAAAQWVNDHGGVTVAGKAYNISLVFYDDQSQTSTIVPLYTKLVQDDKVSFLLAPYSSGLSTAAAPLSDQFNIIMFSHGGAADNLWTHNYKYFIGILTPATLYFKSTVDWLKANHPTDKLAFIYANDAFSVVAAEGGRDYAKSVGLQVVYSQSYPVTVKDITPLLTAAQGAGADDILGGGHFDDGLLVAKQLQQINWKPKLISLLVAVTDPNFQSQLSTVANGITGPSQWEPTVTYTPDAAKSKSIDWFGLSSSEFVSLYGRYAGGKKPPYQAAEAGAAILTLAYALQKANSLDTATVRQTLATMHIMTFYGEFQVDQTGKQVVHAMVLDQWQSGVLRVVLPSEIAEAKIIYPYGS